VSAALLRPHLRRLLAYMGVVAGGWPLAVFGCAAATTHLASAVTHVWPDDHILVRAVARLGRG
jgi:hypothetical protein